MRLVFDDSSTSRRVTIEDDGRVAYAYLLKNDAIVGDVWLYNVGDDPDEVDWKDRSTLPFQNPSAYCGGEVMDRLTESSVIECEWSEHAVVVRLNGETWARLEEGSKPGWSRNAAVAGPLAKPLDDSSK